MRYLYFIAAIALLALGGCATVPAPIAGKDFAEVTPQQAAQQNAHGTRVRWGGEIINVDPKSRRPPVSKFCRASCMPMRARIGATKATAASSPAAKVFTIRRFTRKDAI